MVRALRSSTVALLAGMAVSGCDGSSPATTSGDTTSSSTGDTCGFDSPTTNYCQCKQCQACDGVCTDGCTLGAGCNMHCYHPTAPGPGQFDCAHLIECETGQVCFYKVGNPDGCFEHSCVAPPAVCNGTPTCACLKIAMKDSLDFKSCDDAEGGPTLTFAGDPPWKR